MSSRLCSFRILYSKYKDRAKRKHQEFTLTFKQFYKLMTSPCKCCGAEPETTFDPYANKSGKSYKNRGKGVVIKYNTIDRINNKKGYTPRNTRTLCLIDNRSKSDLPEKVFKAYIQRLIVYRINKMLKESK